MTTLSQHKPSSQQRRRRRAMALVGEWDSAWDLALLVLPWSGAA